MSVREILLIAFYIYVLLVILALIAEERDPSTTLAWVLTLVTFPVVGLLLFLVFGRNLSRSGKSDRRRREAQELARAAMGRYYERWNDSATAAIEELPSGLRRLPTLIERQNRTRALPATDLEVYVGGEAKFARLLQDIAAATDHIHLQYFIWESDELTAQVCDLLAQKARQGVEVRVLYDWVGSLPYRKRQLGLVVKAGGQVRADAAHWSRFNYRNHRKIAVVDGRIGYTGGMNMGREYIDGKPRYASWRDTHCRFGGPLVAELQCLFAERWYRESGERLFGDRYVRSDLGADGAARVSYGQVCHSGPESEREEIRNAFLVAIAAATDRVWIQSPYFVPDDAIMQALITQALAGVDVQFMMTGVPDKKLAWHAAFSYIDEFIEAGGRMYQYDAGFFHPKCLTVDGAIGVVGTTNFDIRSFLLHDELSVFFYDAHVAETIEASFEADKMRCHLLDHDAYARMGRWRRFRNAMARLSSRLL